MNPFTREKVGGTHLPTRSHIQIFITKLIVVLEMRCLSSTNTVRTNVVDR